MMEIFASDINGFQPCDVKDDEVVINAANSYVKAYNDIEDPAQNPKTTFYTCKYCHLLFKHPKRFLIHCKWHQIHTDSLKRQASLAFKNEKTKKVKLEPGESSDECNSDDKEFDENGTKKFCWRTNRCQFCDIPLPTLNMSKEHHDTVHKVDGMFKCPYCDKKYRHKYGWTKHAYTHKEATLECAECPKKFPLKQLLDEHIARCHNERKKSHKCSYCGRGFVDRQVLDIHERRHRNEKVHQCTICNKFYTSATVLKKHMRNVHSEDNAFNCDLADCSLTFATQFLKKIHMQRVHSMFDGKKMTFPCKVCGLVLVTPGDLKRHKTVHRNDIQEDITSS